MGTLSGKLRNVGSNTVNVGIDRSRFMLCGWKNLAASLVITMIAIDARNVVHSSAMFVGLNMLMFVPYCCVVKGHNSWTWPAAM